jgi:hypothetical protein
VHHQYRDADLLQVIGEVDDAVVVRLHASDHALPPSVLDDRLGGFDPGPVETVERAGGQLVVEVRAVGGGSVWKSSTMLLTSPCRSVADVDCVV